MKVFLYLICVCGWMMTACEQNEDVNIGTTSGLTNGFWVNPQYTDTLVTFQKSASIDNDGYCFGFGDDSTFVEHKNIGWCATPPVAYGNYGGTWYTDDNENVYIRVGFWGGIAEYHWKIIALNHHSLTIARYPDKYIYTEYTGLE